MTQLYKKKPVIVEVLQWDGDNLIDIFKFIGKTANYGDNSGLTISTLEGEMSAAIGDYIIKGVNGEFYPCKPDIFHKTYEVYE